jgi:cysteinyl-tRNA synthetase
LVLSTHWRSPLDYSEQLLVQARAAHERLSGFRDRITEIATRKERQSSGGYPPTLKDRLEKLMKNFYDALENDVNTPRAIAELFNIVAFINPYLENGSLSKSAAKIIAAFFKEADSILGIIGAPARAVVPPEVKRLIARRELLRQNKKWHAADELRRRIEKMGWIIEDTSSGPRLRRK